MLQKVELLCAVEFTKKSLYPKLFGKKSSGNATQQSEFDIQTHSRSMLGYKDHAEKRQDHHKGEPQ